MLSQLAEELIQPLNEEIDTLSNNPEPVCTIGHHSILIDFETFYVQGIKELAGQ